MPLKNLYHVSCAHNHDSIMANGLIPYRFTSFNEKPGPIYLAKKLASEEIDLMKPVEYSTRSNRILDDYMQMSAYKHEECPKFNLYRINAENLDRKAFGKTDDIREIKYKKTINPRDITLIAQYDTNKINEKFIQNENTPRYSY